jgi:hypothetical protein
MRISYYLARRMRVGSAANSQNIAGKWHRRRATLSCRAYTMNSLFILPRPCLAFVQPREFYLLAGTALFVILLMTACSLECAFQIHKSFRCMTDCTGAVLLNCCALCTQQKYIPLTALKGREGEDLRGME